MAAVTIIINIVLILVSIILILTVLMQQGQRQGLGAIGGGAETFFGKNKAKSYEGKLAKLTKICAIVFILLALVATIVSSLPEKDDEIVVGGTETVETADDETVEETETAADEAETTDIAAETEETVEENTEAEETEGEDAE